MQKVSGTARLAAARKMYVAMERNLWNALYIKIVVRDGAAIGRHFLPPGVSEPAGGIARAGRLSAPAHPLTRLCCRRIFKPNKGQTPVVHLVGYDAVRLMQFSLHLGCGGEK